MKFLLGILLISLIGFGANQIFPWWIIAVVGMIIGAILNLSGWKSFCYGFLGVALLWSLLALFQNNANDGLLASRIATLLGDLNEVTLILATAIIGGIVSGLGTATGSLGRQIFTHSS